MSARDCIHLGLCQSRGCPGCPGCPGKLHQANSDGTRAANDDAPDTDVRHTPSEQALALVSAAAWLLCVGVVLLTTARACGVVA